MTKTINVGGRTIEFSDAEIAEMMRCAHESTWPKTPAGHIDTHAAMTHLARLFTCASILDAADPWDPERVMRWLASGAPTGGTGHIGRFLLHVWNSETDWERAGADIGIHSKQLRPFSVSDALGAWDADNRRAFLTWASDPFWP